MDPYWTSADDPIKHVRQRPVPGGSSPTPEFSDRKLTASLGGSAPYCYVCLSTLKHRISPLRYEDCVRWSLEPHSSSVAFANTLSAH